MLGRALICPPPSAPHYPRLPYHKEPGLGPSLETGEEQGVSPFPPGDLVPALVSPSAQ